LLVKKQPDAEVRQPFISRACITFMSTIYYHNSWRVVSPCSSFARLFLYTAPK
jgi:hypothetical protein